MGHGMYVVAMLSYVVMDPWGGILAEKRGSTWLGNCEVFFNVVCICCRQTSQACLGVLML